LKPHRRADFRCQLYGLDDYELGRAELIARETPMPSPASRWVTRLAVLTAVLSVGYAVVFPHALVAIAAGYLTAYYVSIVARAATPRSDDAGQYRRLRR
jgi:hypothetical protein